MCTRPHSFILMLILPWHVLIWDAFLSPKKRSRFLFQPDATLRSTDLFGYIVDKRKDEEFHTSPVPLIYQFRQCCTLCPCLDYGEYRAAVPRQRRPLKAVYSVSHEMRTTNSCGSSFSRRSLGRRAKCYKGCGDCFVPFTLFLSTKLPFRNETRPRIYTYKGREFL